MWVGCGEKCVVRVLGYGIVFVFAGVCGVEVIAVKPDVDRQEPPFGQGVMVYYGSRTTTTLRQGRRRVSYNGERCVKERVAMRGNLGHPVADGRWQ